MLHELDFGLLQKYVIDPMITDINYNGKQLWLDHLSHGRYAVDDFNAHEFMQQLVYKIANIVNLPFNNQSPVIEAETKDLRISLLHPSIARGGLSLSIRKTPSVCRLHDPTTGINTYAPKWVIDYLQEAIKTSQNIMVSGLPGSGKTELVKYLMEFIPPSERVITIEDTLELRYGDIHPHKDHVMIKIKENFDYEQAIKCSLRQRPNWICISEVRGKEIIHLLQSVSTGTKLISTIHAESAYSIPFRMMVMMPGSQLTNQSLNTLIHDTLDIGIHIEVLSHSKGIERRIREIVSYRIDENYQCIKECIYDVKNETTKAKKSLPKSKKVIHHASS